MNDVIEEVEKNAVVMQALGMQKREALRFAIDQMQQSMLANPNCVGDDPFPLKHEFADGIYLRRIFIPKGHIIIGKIHKTRHVVFLTVGDVTMLTEEGVRRVQGPSIMIAEPGTKRVVYAHEDTLWTNVHATNETDLDKIEAQVIAKTYDELEG